MIDPGGLPWIGIVTGDDLLCLCRSRDPVVAATPPGLVHGVGPGWLPGLRRTFSRNLPKTVFLLNDCGGDAGFALASLTLGIGVTVPEANPSSRDRLADIGRTLRLPVLDFRRPLLTPADFSVLEP